MLTIFLEILYICHEGEKLWDKNDHVHEQEWQMFGEVRSRVLSYRYKE